MDRAKRKCAFKLAQNAQIQIHPMHAQSVTRAFALTLIHSKMSKILIWSEHLNSAFARRHVFAWHGPNVYSD